MADPHRRLLPDHRHHLLDAPHRTAYRSMGARQPNSTVPTGAPPCRRRLRAGVAGDSLPKVATPLDARIVIEIDYEPTLSSYPDHVKTKYDAMKFDVAAEYQGLLSPIDLLDFAGSLDIRVETQ